TGLRREEQANPFRGEVEQPSEPTPPRRPIWRRRAVRNGALALILLLAVVALTAWLVERWSHVAISDSRIAANLVTVSSEVSGRVMEMPVVVGDTVDEGDVLARIDREQARLALAALDAEIAAIEAEQEQLRAQQEMTRAQLARKIEAGEAGITAAQAAQ